LRLPDAEINIVPLMNKDSLEMSAADRLLLLWMVRAILKENAPMLITHGTDTMVETGLYLQGALPKLEAPIVMTGAMTPLGFEGSDGLQNLTESLLAVRLVAPGIYVVIHRQVFPIDQVRKDHTLSRFDSERSFLSEVSANNISLSPLIWNHQSARAPDRLELLDDTASIPPTPVSVSPVQISRD
jgi:L-asparaginase